MATETILSLREAAKRAYDVQQGERRRQIEEERQSRIVMYRTSLRNAIESTLRVRVRLSDVACTLTSDRLDMHDVPDGGSVAETMVDGLRLMLQRRGGSLRLALYWQCLSCGMEPITDTTISDLADLGALLARLPTLCRHDDEAAS